MIDPRSDEVLDANFRASEMLGYTRNEIINRRLAAFGDRVAVTAGTPFQVPGSTKFLRIDTL